MHHLRHGLVALALIIGLHAPAAAEIFPWWAFDSTLEEIQDRGTLRVGVSLFPPWWGCDTNGELIGLGIDLSEQLARDIGVEVEYVRTNWHYIMSVLNAEEIDIISVMAVLPHRALRVNFSVPYTGSQTVLVTNTSLITDDTTLDDLNAPTVTIGTRRSSATETASRRMLSEATLRLFDTDTTLLAALLAGELHAAVVTDITRTQWVEEHPDTLRKTIAEPIATRGVSFAIRKGDLDTLNFLNSWIFHHSAAGWIQERRAYWFENTEWVERLATDPATIAACEDSFQ